MKKKVFLLILLVLTIIITGCTPELIQKESQIQVGEDYNLSEMVEVEENYEIEIKQDNINNSKIGTYEVIFLINKDEKEYEQTLNFEVMDTKPPEITSKKEEIGVGENFNIEDYFKAVDNLDGDITSEIVILENNLDTSKEGIYTIALQAVDSQENKAEKTFNVKVEDKLEEVDKKVIDIINKYKEILKDPDSLKIYNIKIDEGDIFGWAIKIDYGAKNSYGGYVKDSLYMTEISYDVSVENNTDLFMFYDLNFLRYMKSYNDDKARELDVNKIIRNLDKFN